MAKEEVVATVILAAGLGSRMGGPKALLLIDGEPLALLHAKSSPRPVLVLRREVAAKLALPSHVRVVSSDEDDALGPAGSLRAAVNSGALAGIDVAIVTPVDRLPATKESIASLVRALEGHDAARPLRGHPVVVRGEALRRCYAEEARPLRDVLASLDTVLVDLPECSTRDLDTPEDVRARTGRDPIFLDRS
ncbi:MAG: NTP transferase domain-containing protein [Polyangiales bacterium]